MRLYNARVHDENDNLVPNILVEINENGKVEQLSRQSGYVPEEGDYDCNGYVLLPSYMDCAVSVPGCEVFKTFGINLTDCNSIEDYLSMISENGEDIGIRGYGFSEYILGEDGAVRIKNLMDSMYPSTPCYIFADDLTCVLVNNAVLVDAKKYFYIGAEEYKTGLLNMQQLYTLRKYSDIFDFAPDELRIGVMSFQGEMLSHGITAVRAIDFLGDINVLKTVYELSNNKVWALDMIVNVPVYPFESEEDMLNRYMEYKQYENSKIHVIGLSMTLDGSIDSAQAALSTPYNDLGEWRGTVVWNINKAYAVAKKFYSHGIDININARGDYAVSVAVDILSALRGEYDIQPANRIITHAYLMSQLDMQTCASSGIVVCVEPGSVPYANTFYEGDKRMLGERVYIQYPVGKLIYKGIKILAGSNNPEQLDVSPISGVYKATHRTNADDATSYHVTQGYKDNALEVFGMLDRYGEIEVGKYASFVLVDKDIVRMNEALLQNVNYLATFIDGVVVWESDKLAELCLQREDSE